MPNIIDLSHLTSATTAGGRRCRRKNQARRERRTATQPLKNPLKRRRLSQGCPILASLRRIARPTLAEQNGQTPKLNVVASRQLEQTWLSEHHAEYAGAWIALEGATLVAHGSSARQVLDAAKLEGYEQPLVVHIPSEPPLPFGGW